jgi:hypothetical protein
MSLSAQGLLLHFNGVKRIHMPDTTPTEPFLSFDDEANTENVSAIAPNTSNKAVPSSVQADEQSNELVDQIATTSDEVIPPPENINTGSDTDVPQAVREHDGEEPNYQSVHKGTVEEDDTVIYDTDNDLLDGVVISDDNKSKLRKLLTSKWSWLSLVVLLVIVVALPYSRYKLLGLVLHETVKVTVADSVTHTPVSDAEVKVAGVMVTTNADGIAQIRIPFGKSVLLVSKQYYKSYAAADFISLNTSRTLLVHLQATGRQIPIIVENTLTNQPLKGAEIRVFNTSAKTNRTGNAEVVLPTKQADYAATVMLNGYNLLTFSVQVTNSLVSGNIVHLTPAGQLYFLSNLSGTIDIVKTNLDGTDRQTVLAGTGQENPNTTTLLASQDWKYLVLKAQRSGSQPALYLINTSTDKVTEFDDNAADFTPVGWSGHDFIYDEVFSNVATSQNGHEQLKSYDADTNQLDLLDQNQAEGSPTSYAYQGFYDFYLINGEVLYDTQWNTTNVSGDSIAASSLTDTIRGVEVSGQTKKDYQSIAANTVGHIQTVLAAPQTIYYAVYDATSSSTSYYAFNNQSVTSPSSLNQTTFSQTYPNYLVSPADDRTLWSIMHDGAATTMIGDQNGQSAKQLLRQSSSRPYGWYSDSYVLLSQNNEKLYILPVSGLAANEKPYAITDYYQTPETYSAIEYGYGAQ